MSAADVLRLLRRYWRLLLAVPLVLGSTLFWLTRHEKKSYSSESTIYTGIASGYTLTGNSDTDFFTANNAFDNLLSLIKSRETKEEVAYRLLAYHLQMNDELNPALLKWNSLMRLHGLLPAALRHRLTGPTVEATATSVRAYATASDTNKVYRLLNSGDPVYSVDALGHVGAARINSSDLIKLDYEAEDPAICRHTLQLTTQVFTERYRALRMDQTGAVIRYYEVETEKALRALSTAERKFLAFNKGNDIINYYEQTKYIAGEREELYSDINKIEMQYAAAAAGLAAVEHKLAGRGAALQSTGELLRLRRQLEKLQAEIANQQLFGRLKETGSPVPLQKLQAQVAGITEAMRATLNDHYSRLNSVEGIPSKGLLDEWLRNMLELTENQAKLTVMDKRKREFMAEYHKMAPLGAQLKIIEREIDLAQKTYLVLLNHLNDGRASQQNNKLTTDLKVVAPPFLPLHAKGGKRLALVAGGAFGGFFCVFITLLGLALLDKSLRKPDTASYQTGLPVLGLLPAAADAADYHEAAAAHLARQLLRRVSAHPGPAPYVVGVLSPRQHEGKTPLVRLLAERCRALGLPTLALYPTGSPIPPDYEHALPYAAEHATLHRWGLAELSCGRAAAYKLVIIEFPALLEATYPVTLLPQLHLALLVLQARRRWLPNDQLALAELQADTPAPVEVVLTGVARFDSTDLVIPEGKKAA
jgi:succinoglycan biosynthesis transport protein ExoP